MALSTSISPTLNKKNLVTFGQQTPEIMWLMFTYPKSPLGILHMLMHLTSGHVTLPPGEFHPMNFPPNRTCQADSRWALPQISSFFFILMQTHLKSVNNS